MALVYIVTNKINGKRYVGVTSKTLERRRVGHHWDARHGRQTVFARALRKYGFEAFEWAIARDYLFNEDAFDAEERLIASSRPEYNMAAGGIGVRGLRPSEETRRKMRAAMTPERRAKAALVMSRLARDPEFIRRSVEKRKGGHHKNKRAPMSADLREFHRKRGLANREKWKQFASHGPAASARKVVCLDDGAVYESASAAARAYGVARSALIETCLGKNTRETCGGLRFEYVGSPPPAKTKSKRKLTKDQVREIRALFGSLSHALIARRFLVARATIIDIAHGRSWKEKRRATST